MIRLQRDATAEGRIRLPPLCPLTTLLLLQRPPGCLQPSSPSGQVLLLQTLLLQQLSYLPTPVLFAFFFVS